MFLAKIAIYLFLLVFVLYMAHRVLWLVFFLFNFRIWEMVFEKYANGFFESLSPLQKILLLIIVSVISYLIIYTTTIKMTFIRYILLALMFLIAIREYSIGDILIFKDYLQESGIWGWDYWINQIRGVFMLESDSVFGLFEEGIDSLVSFFMKTVDVVRNL